MFSMDMTGEDVDEDRRQVPDRALARSRRGLGSPLGSAHRVGPRQRAAPTLKGDLINDLHLAVCERVAREDRAGS